MAEDPIKRMRELREANKEIYTKMGEVGAGLSSADE